MSTSMKKLFLWYLIPICFARRNILPKSISVSLLSKNLILPLTVPPQSDLFPQYIAILWDLLFIVTNRKKKSKQIAHLFVK